jgi:hypothetical protein
MVLNQKLADIPADKKTAFFDDFFTEFSRMPFGSMAKRDLECYLLMLLYEHELIPTGSNRAAANSLGVNESRLKTYRLDGRYKYQKDNKDANVRQVLSMIIAETIRPESKGDTVQFALENPVWRADLFQALKDLGYYADTGFNAELVKIRDYAFLALLVQYCGKEQDVFRKIIGTAQADAKEVEQVLKPGKTLMKRSDLLIAYIKEHHHDLLQTSIGLVGLIVTCF